MSKLNTQQQSVVDCNDDRILVLAGAGAGKTHTMLEKINHIVDSGVSPKNILVLTFTNAAGFDMKDRYLRAHPDKKVIPEFRTFHGFCYHLMIVDKQIRDKVGYDSVPSVISEEKLKKIKTEAKMRLNIKLTQAQLEEEDGATYTSAQRASLELFKKHVSNTLRKESLITFSLLATAVSKLFIENDPCTKFYKDKYKYIFVDEFQDTDKEQVRFLSSFKNTKFCVIGDCLQNLYSFRGTTNEIIKALSKSPDWTKIRLFENYRSTNQICEFANKMSTYAEPEYIITMKGQRDGSDVEVIRGSHTDWQNIVDRVHLSILIGRLKQRTNKDKDVAILCRTNKEVRYICDALKDAGILFSSGKRNDDALSILKSVNDNDYMLDWLSSFLDVETYAEYIRLAAQEENPNIVWFSKKYGNIPDIQSRGKAVTDIRKILKKKSNVVSKLGDILMVLGIKSGDMMEIQSDEDILPTLIDKITEQGDQDIYVGTIHSSKGLEYDTVYVMGVNDNSFQLRSEDMYNLYYVAITRAKNNLVVFTR